MTVRPSTFKTSLLALSMAAALAACGGGGGDSGTTPAATTPTPTPTAPTTPTTPTAPTASTGTTTSPASDTTPTSIQPGLPPAPSVPTANLVTTNVAAGSYASSPESLAAWNSTQDWRARMRTVDTSAFGVGLLTQVASLDGIAQALATGSPNLTSTNAADRAAALAAATTQMTNAGYPQSVVIANTTTNPLNIGAGTFCSKAIFSALPGVELATSGMRDAGIYSPATAGGNCVLVAGLTGSQGWQLPPTGSSSVYPFPGKLLTLTQYWGDFASLGFAARPGHIVFASVASVDALPVAVPGAGSGAAIATSAITLNQFSLAVRDSGAAVDARVLVPAGVVRGAGVTADDSTAFRFPTSMALIPTAALLPNTAYRAQFRATVNGRTVTRTWEFTTADN